MAPCGQRQKKRKRAAAIAGNLDGHEMIRSQLKIIFPLRTFANYGFSLSPSLIISVQLLQSYFTCQKLTHFASVAALLLLFNLPFLLFDPTSEIIC